MAVTAQAITRAITRRTETGPVAPVGALAPAGAGPMLRAVRCALGLSVTTLAARGRVGETALAVWEAGDERLAAADARRLLTVLAAEARQQADPPTDPQAGTQAEPH